MPVNVVVPDDVTLVTLRVSHRIEPHIKEPVPDKLLSNVMGSLGVTGFMVFVRVVVALTVVDVKRLVVQFVALRVVGVTVEAEIDVAFKMLKSSDVEFVVLMLLAARDVVTSRVVRVNIETVVESAIMGTDTFTLPDKVSTASVVVVVVLPTAEVISPSWAVIRSPSAMSSPRELGIELKILRGPLLNCISSLLISIRNLCQILIFFDSNIAIQIDTFICKQLGSGSEYLRLSRKYKWFAYDISVPFEWLVDDKYLDNYVCDLNGYVIKTEEEFNYAKQFNWSVTIKCKDLPRIPSIRTEIFGNLKHVKKILKDKETTLVYKYKELLKCWRNLSNYRRE